METREILLKAGVGAAVLRPVVVEVSRQEID
jgi:hypothetical protein